MRINLLVTVAAAVNAHLVAGQLFFGVCSFSKSLWSDICVILQVNPRSARSLLFVNCHARLSAASSIARD
jgi:hypothetical protein